MNFVEKGPSIQEKGEKSFEKPLGFSDARAVRGQENEPSNLEEYRKEGLAGEVGEYNSNNGAISAITSKGEVIVWLPKEGPREGGITFEKAVKILEDAGYKENGNMYVPFSNLSRSEKYASPEDLAA